MELLDFVSVKEQGKTKIMFKLFMNSLMINKYLNLLLRKNMIKKKGKAYSITEKGAQYLKILHETNKIFQEKIN